MTSPAQTPGQAATRQQRSDPRAKHSSPAELAFRFRAAALPWYGLDDGWFGSRRVGGLCTDPDGTVRYGTLEHGDAPAGRPGVDPQRRAVTVVTMAALPSRPELRSDGTVGPGVIEAATVATVAAVAGIGLVEDQWPWHLEVAVRQSWLDQQREMAAQVADRLGDLPWRLLTLTVDGMPQVFHYRESEYGWVLATATRRCLLAAYGRGVSAYSLAFTRAELDQYDD
ncbi:MAG TPA: hypothetical protein VGZ32_24235 [Actinocrinis sp.]|uniref:hypothetical protein n=1 Tax=Actinocrinis sp. TaxID=1920516 RepID=UPI002DDDA943|nr:hypothetical protein [Actinocrinis sp.]HEV3173480.1 hypothetical protein [Actinocrinis sp.]